MDTLTYCSDQQRDIVLSEHNTLLIQGCAGSQKTNTIVKLIYKLLLQQKSVLILTLVGSVTMEICQRIEALLDIRLQKRGNHYFYDWDTHSIEVSNFDAAIHSQLSYVGDRLYTQVYGDCHEEKCEVLLQKYVATGLHKSFVLMNGKIANALIVDEFQDLTPMKTRLLVDTIKQYETPITSVAAGDRVQSIFDHAFVPGEDHPMDVWEKELDPVKYTLSKCFRLPKAHVLFVNEVMRPYYEKHGVPPMETTNDDMYHTPTIFISPPSSNNKLSMYIAVQVRNALDALFDIDPDVRPQDVAILMARTNNNHVFKQLHFELQQLYHDKFGLEDAVKIFETRVGQHNISIDWDKAEGKTVMLSIHGDKGKGHKVVFFLGFSENSIPKAKNLFTERALIDESLAYVALTRSTRWLFVGVTQHNPSRYIRDISHKADPPSTKLQELCVLSWDDTTWTLPWHEKMCNAINNNLWTITHGNPQPLYIDKLYITEKINAPDKFRMRVKEDIAQSYEHPKRLVAAYPWREVPLTKFGTNIAGMFNVVDEHLPFFGNMGEIIFQHYHSYMGGAFTNEYDFLLDPDRVFYTDNHIILNIIQDVELNRHIMSDITGLHYHTIISNIISEDKHVQTSPELMDIFKTLAESQSPLFVVPTILKDEKILGHVRRFLERGVATEEVPSEVFWAMAIIQDIVYSPLRNPMVFRYIDAFSQDVFALVENIKAFYRLIQSRAKKIVFHRPVGVLTIENNPDVLKDMGVTERLSVALGITGVCDFDIEDEIFEIKTPVGSKYNNRWVIQPLMYACLNTKQIKAIHVVDFTNGEWRRFENIDEINRRFLVKKVLTKFAHRPDHISALLGVLGRREGGRAPF